MKFLILTCEEKTLSWKSLPDKLADIQDTLGDGWSINIKPFYGEVHISGDRIDRDWLGRLTKSYFDEGCDVIALHMSMKQKKDWGIKPTLRGVNPNRNTEVGDFYFWASELTKREGENQFVQTCLHEFAHEYYHQTKLPDMTHSYHKANPDIRGLFRTFDWKKYQPKRMRLKTIKKLLERVLELQRALLAKKQSTRLIHPVKEYQEMISQAYGVPNPTWYPTTGHHIGTDYACPVGTSVMTPCDGEVIASGYSDSLGNYCHYKYEYGEGVYVARMMHLSYIPELGSYRAGKLLAKSGNSGRVSGAHLHIDVWVNEVRLDLLTKKTWREMTVDPYIHYSVK